MDNPTSSHILNGMNYEADVTIVGGGLNGCALALALASAGFRTVVVDTQDAQNQSDEFDGRAYALALSSKRLLSALGLWSDLDATAEPMLEIKVTDGRQGEGPSPFWMHFDHTEIEEGPMGFMVEDRYLRQAFLDAMKSSAFITHLTSETVVSQRIDGGTATAGLASGGQISSKVLVGCDGRKSGTAERAGITRSFKDYGQTALVAAIGHEKPHRGIAHQFFMPEGPLAILPLTGNRSSIVWAVNHARADMLSQTSDQDFIDALSPAFGDFLGDLTVAGARFSYPLNLTEARSLVADRVALVGDAAHGIHPIAGQGLNQGLRDIAALAEVLTDAVRRGEDIGSENVLARYAEWRRFDAKTLAFATDTFNTMFSNDNPTVRLGRDIGMGIVNAVPALRRGFMREAAGLTGDVPKLLKGRLL